MPRWSILWADGHRSLHHASGRADRSRRAGDGLAVVGGGALEAFAEARELRRLLYVLDAVIALHLAAEEELLAQAEEAGGR